MTEKDILALLKPETEIEHLILTYPEVLQGLDWGEPRFGHPEGKVVYHVAEIYNNLEYIRPKLSTDDRKTLRTIALLHDTFKFREDKSEPRDWTKHHSALAANFAENIIKDSIILDITRQHDEAFYCWKLYALEEQPKAAFDRLNWLMEKIGYCLQLYYIFFTCDTATGDKNQTPVCWFEQNISGLEKVWFER